MSSRKNAGVFFYAYIIVGMSSPTLELRFWKYVVKGPGCWGWSGYAMASGYGFLSNGRKPSGKPLCVYAHRLSWEIHNGPVPAGKMVLHHCDNPPCCNPAHLYAGTGSDNARDMWERHPYWIAKRKEGKRRQAEKRAAQDAVTAARRKRLADRDAAIVAACKSPGVSQEMAAIAFGLDRALISRIVNRK